MSEHYVFQFDFGLRPDAPPAALRAMSALAEGRAPTREDLDGFRLGRFLDPAMMMAMRPASGTPLVLWETGIVNDPSNRYHAPLPERGARFSFTMHDDHYANGGYVLPLAVFDLVGEHGLFGQEFDETNRTAVKLYFKEFDDLIIQAIDAPSFAHPLPPNAALEPQAYLRDWRPATAAAFKFGTFTRLGPEERATLIAEADAMFDPPSN
jgi:hypothetical protein